jgi:hypothetical protein
MGPGKIKSSTKVTCMCGKVKDKNRKRKKSTGVICSGDPSKS